MISAKEWEQDTISRMVYLPCERLLITVLAGCLMAFQCLTLAPVVALQAKVASDEDKKALAKGWTCQGHPSTGSVQGDILKLSSQISE
jgi:hypothetical protein